MKVSVQHHVPAALPPEKNTSTHLIECWVGHRAGMKISKKRKISWPYLASNHRTSSPLSSHYTDCTTPAHLQPISRSVEVHRNGKSVFSTDAHSISQKIVNCPLTNAPHGPVNINSTFTGHYYTGF